LDDLLPFFGSVVIYLILDKALKALFIEKVGVKNVTRFGLMNTWFELFYLPKGIMLGIVKILFYVYFFVIGFIRPDCSVMPFGCEDWDTSHYVYMSGNRLLRIIEQIA